MANLYYVLAKFKSCSPQSDLNGQISLKTFHVAKISCQKIVKMRLLLQTVTLLVIYLVPLFSLGPI